MKRICGILVLLFLMQLTHGQINRSDVLHFTAGGLFGLAGAGIAKKASKGNRLWTFAGAVGGSALIGLGKEAIDIKGSEFGWSNSDLLYTVLGGTAVGITIDLTTDHNNKRQKKRLQKLREQYQNAEASKKVQWQQEWEVALQATTTVE